MKPRPIRIEGSVAYVTLTKGCEAIIDTDDVHLVEGYNWYAKKSQGKTLYACRQSRCENGKQKVVRLHRVIASPSPHELVDHRDGDGLNNRKSNLRTCSTAENQCNRGMAQHNRSGFKGVSWHSGDGKWRAQIGINGVPKYLGSFDCPKEAHEAYCKAGQELHGEYFNNGVQS